MAANTNPKIQRKCNGNAFCKGTLFGRERVLHGNAFCKGTLFTRERFLQGNAFYKGTLFARKHFLQWSMSGKGNYHDIAFVETFFKTSKAELVLRRTWEPRLQTETSTFQCINSFYIKGRSHSALEGKSSLTIEREEA